MSSDCLRPPGPFDADAARYKDWLHLIVLDHASDAAGLVNVSLHGPPGDSRSRAVGTTLFHLPGTGWVGNLDIQPTGDAAIGAGHVGVRHVGLAVHGDAVKASATFPDERVSVEVEARFAAPPVLYGDQRSPLGSGWISWYVVPQLAIEGRLVIGPATLNLNGASAYYDHNWGRWRWGDDFGWEWGVLSAPPPGPTFVVSRTTDRRHLRRGIPMLTVNGPVRRRFLGPSIEHRYEGQWRGSLRRFPGALAALYPDRRHPRLPARVHVQVDDGRDRVALRFETRAAAQIIASDPFAPGASSIHQLVGRFEYETDIDGRQQRGSGLGVIEHVE